MIKKKILQFIPMCIATLVSFLPFNIIIGSHAAWFSYSSMALPALGYQSSLLYVILFIFTKSLFSVHSFLFCVMHRLPLIFSTLALQKRDWKISLLLPSVAMILFCVHPVGQQVFYYSWYWFVPMIIYVFAQDTIYSRACTASFIAHAVGSVIWLYCGTVPVQVWAALMPIVAIERILIAAGMISFTYIFQAISNFYYSKVAA